MALKTIDRLVFVYNADAGKLAALIDGAKKVLKINDCPLCTITHGLTGEKTAWKTCREEIGVPVELLHRDEVTGRLRELVSGQLPAVVAETSGQLVLLLTPDVIDRCKGNVSDLKGRMFTHASMKGLAFPSTETRGASDS